MMNFFGFFFDFLAKFSEFWMNEFWPNSDLNSSFGSVPRWSNLSTQVYAGLNAVVAAVPELRSPAAGQCWVDRALVVLTGLQVPSKRVSIFARSVLSSVLQFRARLYRRWILEVNNIRVLILQHLLSSKRSVHSRFLRIYFSGYLQTFEISFCKFE